MDIYERIAALPADEQRLVEACISRVLDRLDAGRAQYGPWSITRDRRLDIDHYREATEELTDGLVYLAMSALVRGV